jgi:hypothetical protein
MYAGIVTKFCKEEKKGGKSSQEEAISRQKKMEVGVNSKNIYYLILK